MVLTNNSRAPEITLCVENLWRWSFMDETEEWIKKEETTEWYETSSAQQLPEVQNTDRDLACLHLLAGPMDANTLLNPQLAILSNWGAAEIASPCVMSTSKHDEQVWIVHWWGSKMPSSQKKSDMLVKVAQKQYFHLY